MEQPELVVAEGSLQPAPTVPSPDLADLPPLLIPATATAPAPASAPAAAPVSAPAPELGALALVDAWIDAALPATAPASTPVAAVSAPIPAAARPAPVPAPGRTPQQPATRPRRDGPWTPVILLAPAMIAGVIAIITTGFYVPSATNTFTGVAIVAGVIGVGGLAIILRAHVAASRWTGFAVALVGGFIGASLVGGDDFSASQLIKYVLGGLAGVAVFAALPPLRRRG